MTSGQEHMTSNFGGIFETCQNLSGFHFLFVAFLRTSVVPPLFEYSDKSLSFNESLK
jgi:hypothetical protein